MLLPDKARLFVRRYYFFFSSKSPAAGTPSPLSQRKSDQRDLEGGSPESPSPQVPVQPLQVPTSAPAAPPVPAAAPVYAAAAPTAVAAVLVGVSTPRNSWSRDDVEISLSPSGEPFVAQARDRCAAAPPSPEERPFAMRQPSLATTRLVTLFFLQVPSPSRSDRGVPYLARRQPGGREG